MHSHNTTKYLQSCDKKKIDPDPRKIQGMTAEEILNLFYESVEYKKNKHGWQFPEELTFFKDTNIHPGFPFLLTFLTSPSIVYETFPFIFFIATQFLFLKLMDKEELKVAGVGEEMIRVSVGLEDTADLVSDLRQALRLSQK